MAQTTPAADDRAADPKRRPSAFALALLGGFALFPFVGFAYENRGEPVDLVRLALYAVVVWLVAVGALWLWLVARPRIEPDRAAVVVATVVFSIFAFSWWLQPDPRNNERFPQLVAWVVITAAFAVLLYRFSRRPGLRTFLLFLAVLLPVVPAVGLVMDALASPSSPLDRPAEPPVALDLPDGVDPPNIYHFVLDFYDREDQLEQLTGFDNSPFLDDLESRGFQVADEAVASYPITALSVSSTLDMDYLATEPDDLSAGFDPFFDIVRGDNHVVTALKDVGYTFVYSSNGTFNGFDCSKTWADECIRPTTSGLPVSDLEYNLLELTPLGSLDLAQKPYTDPVYVVDELEALDPPEPFFLLAHVISPHPPYRFDEDCERRARPAVRRQDDPEGEVRNYVTDIGCINDLMIEATDRILEADPTAVIIVQSDHGSEFLTPWYEPFEAWSDEALAERYSVLDAMRLPESCDGIVDDDEALVNTYRVVFACLSGEEPERLPYEAFLFRWGDEDDLVPIPPERIERSG